MSLTPWNSPDHPPQSRPSNSPRTLAASSAAVDALSDLAAARWLTASPWAGSGAVIRLEVELDDFDLSFARTCPDATNSDRGRGFSASFFSWMDVRRCPVCHHRVCHIARLASTRRRSVALPSFLRLHRVRMTRRRRTSVVVRRWRVGTRRPRLLQLVSSLVSTVCPTLLRVLFVPLFYTCSGQAIDRGRCRGLKKNLFKPQISPKSKNKKQIKTRRRCCI